MVETPGRTVRATSESEEMYLITVARAAESGHALPIPVALIAGNLGVSVASANEMVRKLASRDLMTYEPYHGVGLTDAGVEVADRVLRTRRLWATFLATQLGFSPTDADDQACELEHVTTADAADRLADYLGNPEVGPLGHRIPRPAGIATGVPVVSLTSVPAGTEVETVGVTASGASLAFLSAEGIVPGSMLQIVATGRSGLLVTLDGDSIHLSADMAGTIEVRVVSPH